MSKENDVAIKVSHVSKSFKLPHEKNTSIKSFVVNPFKKRTYERQEVLKDINFEIKKGEFFGIVGRNGSGKSTLLKLIAGIYSPNIGHIQINGKLTPFIELGVGFNPELTGRENVFLNGALLGFNRKEMNALYDEIVEFAELEKFMDQKLKNYSSGMQVRLAFSIAIRANTDILILDEVLAVGDAAFQRKCFDYFDELKKTRKTVVLVTHDMGSVERFCTRALLIENGDIKLIGKPQEVARQYTLDNMVDSRVENKPAIKKNQNRKLNKEIESLGINLLSKKSLKNSDDLRVQVSYKLKDKIEVDLGISISYQGRSLVEHNTKELKLNYKVGVVEKIDYIYPLESLNPGVYEISVAIFEKKKFKLIGYNTDSCSFMVEGTKIGGILSKTGDWMKVDD